VVGGRGLEPLQPWIHSCFQDLGTKSYWHQLILYLLYKRVSCAPHDGAVSCDVVIYCRCACILC
jgi:hypothetical protein